MATSGELRGQLKPEFNVDSYQHFWEDLDPEVLTRYAGKFVALKCCDNGWEIVETSDELNELQELLAASGADVSRVILDRIHTEDATAPGVELQ